MRNIDKPRDGDDAVCKSWHQLDFVVIAGKCEHCQGCNKNSVTYLCFSYLQSESITE